MPQKLAPRRQPQQARSRERVERILAATAELVQQRGLAAVNTNAIAKRAGLPVGTLYQFFPNREAVLKAVMQTQLEKFDEAVVPLLSASEDEQPLGEQVDRIVDALSKAYLAVPGLATLLQSMKSEPALAASSAENNARIAAVLAELVRRRVPALSPKRARAISTAAVEAADGVLMMWLKTRDRALLVELKVMLRAYGAQLLAAAARG
ncbi:MAG: TetR/AcrR family transcriptional regulator [Myxococcaceae bacterium]|nr:TetR/AcrR family transcriptional regulator [Myxococcaceae bacterium]